MLAAVAGRSYAEICLRRGDGVLPAHLPEHGEFTAGVEAARSAEDRDIVIDMPAVTVLLALPDDVRRAAMNRFARVLATDDMMVDALAAMDTLAFRSAASMRYDERQDHLQHDEIPQAEADRLAEEAVRLHAAIEALTRRSTPTRPSSAEPRTAKLRTWASSLDLALAEGAVLWSDDPVLRAHARVAGVPAASTLAVLHRLHAAGEITDDQHEDCIRRLIKTRIGNMPLNEQRLFELAEDDKWHPGAVALALARPTTWTDPLRTLAFYRRLTEQARIHAVDTLPSWLYAAVRGATVLLDRPDRAAGVAAGLLTATVGTVPASSQQITQLVAATRRALADTDDPDQPPAADPLPITATLLRNAYATTLSHELAVRFVIATFAALTETDRRTVIRSLLE